MKAIVQLLLRLWFRFRAYNVEALKTPGPVLLVPNHVSWLDWLFLYAVLDDDWKCVVSASTAERSWFHRRIMLNRRTFPVDPNSPQGVRAMAEYLEAGGRLVLFAEGRISTTGRLMKLFDGTGFLVRQSGARVITCHLRGAQRVRWVRHQGWTKWFPTVTAHFSAAQVPPAYPGVSHAEDRRRVTQWLRDAMVTQQFEVEQAFGARTVPAALAEIARQIPATVALEDASGSSLTYRKLMQSSAALDGALRSNLATPGGGRVGVLLPTANATVVTLFALWRAGRVPTLLNFSSGTPSMLLCARVAGLREIVTSRAFVAAAGLDLAPFIADGVVPVYLEDLKAGIGPSRKLAAASPLAFRGHRALTAADTAVVLFTSGSENTPKAVELTHANLLANVRQSLATMDLTDADRFFNALPLFHSFGLTAGTLLPLLSGCYTYLFPSPLQYRAIPAVIYDRNCTVLLATNTFLNGWARKAHAYDFRTVRYLIAGAEKVQEATLEAWSRQFGVRILEGYGATECSPVVSVNTWIGAKTGSAGRLLPGIEYRLEPVEGVASGGRLFVRGPNVMKGYLNADANARFQALQGWYDTGDIAEIDADGFVQLRGRMKRFAKVSGEMISLTAVEDALAGAFPRFGPRCEIAIVSRPDEEKGEALVAVTNEPRLQLTEVRAALRAKGLSNLAVPRGLRVVPAIPKLGTGKVNHRELSRLLESAAATAPDAAGGLTSLPDRSQSGDCGPAAEALCQGCAR
jgi:acyl-[acyl-carrier-protein]-phospholipid O-acyltransferase/long-chain-fatty-acid--[acyl-carrier-protein] ligase